MSKHTPGPWLIEAQNCHFGDIATVHNTDEKWVTIYAPHWMETGMDEKEQSANARLIAAAPELLEALKKISAIENQMYGADWEEIEEARDIADAAIAKATGETQ